MLESAAGNLDRFAPIEDQVAAIDDIVNLSESSLKRIENAYQMDKSKYGSSFEDIQPLNQNKQKPANDIRFLGFE